jgi:hypothetical protein
MLTDKHPFLGGAGHRHLMLPLLVLITSAHLPVIECLMLEDSHPLLGRAGHRHLILPLLVLTFL